MHRGQSLVSYSFACGLLVLAGCAPSSAPSAQMDASVKGIVVTKSGQAIADAEVRFKGGLHSVATDAQGRFALPAIAGGQRLTAWAPGFFIGGADLGESESRIVLRPLPARDNPDYAWVDPGLEPAGEHNCANCHESIYQQWRSGGHAQALANRRFLDIYAGTNWRGQRAGWSLKDDYPSGASVCAACHGPTVPLDDPALEDLRLARGVAAHGVHCDYCHKIEGLAPGEVGLAHGRFAVKLLRPSEGQLFFGPLADVDRDEDVYSPLLRESRFCASCHEGVVFGVHVYSTYSEWLESPARLAGKACQSCHMRPNGELTNIAPGSGGIERDPSTLASHTLLPGGRAAMLRSCLSLETKVEETDDGVAVAVTVTARNVGHRVPTGFIDRHLLLLVAGEAADGEPVELLAGPTLEAVGDDELVGQAGWLYAKLLAAPDGAAPSPFWREHGAMRDTRLTPGSPHTTTYRFAGPAASIRVQLIYRRFWRDVGREKGWPDDSITVFDARHPVGGE